MTRSIVISAIRQYLQDSYIGPVGIHPETGTEPMDPPYAVVRIGGGEQLYPGVAEIWDMTVMIGVFHDADSTSEATAEAQAAQVFAMIDDPSGLISDSEASLAWSTMERIGTDASINESNWQHIAIYRAIVAPV